MSQGYYKLPGGRVASIDGDCEFPPVTHALREPNGLLAIGGDLSMPRLLNAYRQGIFPWFSEGEPILWWSPDPRMVLLPDDLKISTSLKKSIKQQKFEIRFNTAFREVISACSTSSRIGQSGTWITDEIIAAYCRLYEAGFAISAEAWLDHQLVGGCYGVRIGRMFYGESMFYRVSDASKIAFVHLVELLNYQGVKMIDCQMNTAHLARFGAKGIPRDLFMRILQNLL